MLRRAALVLTLVAALVLAGVGAAGAHGPAPALSAAAPVAPAPAASLAAAAPVADVPLWPWLAPLALLPLLGRRRTRKVVATALAIVVVVFAAESAVHSIHHGLGGERSAVCPVASAATHVAGTDVETVAVEGPAPALDPAVQESDPLASKLRQLGPHQGRAPPSALA